MNFAINEPSIKPNWNEVRNELQLKLNDTHRQLAEVSMKLEQSQFEISKLAQRNVNVNAELQKVQTKLESVPRIEIRTLYDSALEAQQRLFIMRGLIEKLQTEKNHLTQYASLLEQTLNTLEQFVTKDVQTKSASATKETLEAMVQAQEAERLRLSRQMHDGPAQALSNFIMQTEIAMRLFDIDQKKAREELENLKSMATSTFKHVRDFIFELRPMMLDDLGLIPTLKKYIDAFREKSGLDIQLTFSGSERRLESYLEVMIFRAIQEILNLAVYRGQANHIKIKLNITETTVQVFTEDDGKGFDPGEVMKETEIGLKVIKERTETLGGYFEAESVAGQGARFDFEIPVTNIEKTEN